MKKKPREFISIQESGFLIQEPDSGISRPFHLERPINGAMQPFWSDAALLSETVSVILLTTARRSWGVCVLLEENLPFREVFAGGWNSGGHPRVLQGAHWRVLPALGPAVENSQIESRMAAAAYLPVPAGLTPLSPWLELCFKLTSSGSTWRRCNIGSDPARLCNTFDGDGFLHTPSSGLCVLCHAQCNTIQPSLHCAKLHSTWKPSYTS